MTRKPFVNNPTPTPTQPAPVVQPVAVTPVVTPTVTTIPTQNSSGLGHSLQDLSKDAQAAIVKARQDEQAVQTFSSIQQQAVQQPQQVVQAPKEVEVRYVRVPETDYSAEGFRRSLAAEVETNPHLLAIINRIENNAKVWTNGMRSNKRMYNVGPAPVDIPLSVQEQK